MEAAQAFCDFTVNYQKKTPKGLVYIDKFGTLCHAANVAFVCLQVTISLYSKTFLVQFPNILKFCVSASDRLNNCELIFIVALCILIFTQFIHQQMHIY